MCTAERISGANKDAETVERKGMILGTGVSILIIGSVAGVAAGSLLHEFSGQTE